MTLKAFKPEALKSQAVAKRSPRFSMFIDEEKKVRQRGTLYKAVFPNQVDIRRSNILELELEECLQALSIQNFHEQVLTKRGSMH